MRQNETLLLFGGRGMLVALLDHPSDLQTHAERLANAADGTMACAEALADADWVNNQDEIAGAVASARVLVQLCRAAIVAAAKPAVVA